MIAGNPCCGLFLPIALVPLPERLVGGHRPAKTSRIELRATEDDRDLPDRAATALGTDRSSFLLAQGRLARLLQRPSPFG